MWDEIRINYSLNLHRLCFRIIRLNHRRVYTHTRAHARTRTHDDSRQKVNKTKTCKNPIVEFIAGGKKKSTHYTIQYNIYRYLYYISSSLRRWYISSPSNTIFLQPLGSSRFACVFFFFFIWFCFFLTIDLTVFVCQGCSHIIILLELRPQSTNK